MQFLTKEAWFNELVYCDCEQTMQPFPGRIPDLSELSHQRSTSAPSAWLYFLILDLVPCSLLSKITPHVIWLTSSQ